jgi:hypothetical protein
MNTARCLAEVALCDVDAARGQRNGAGCSLGAHRLLFLTIWRRIPRPPHMSLGPTWPTPYHRPSRPPAIELHGRLLKPLPAQQYCTPSSTTKSRSIDPPFCPPLRQPNSCCPRRQAARSAAAHRKSKHGVGRRRPFAAQEACAHDEAVVVAVASVRGR